MKETYPPTPASPAQPPLETNVALPNLTGGLTTGLDCSSSTIVVEHNRRRRGADPSRDNVWSRNHAICLAGVMCDNFLGGYDAARAALAPLKMGLEPREFVLPLIFTCQWLLKPGYLNLEGSAGLQTKGLTSCAQSWISNRIYYFFYDPARSEHPCFRRKNNLRAVYKDFYDAFIGDVHDGKAISERDAEAFWLCVVDRVPFLRPLTPLENEQVAQRPIEEEVAHVG